MSPSPFLHPLPSEVLPPSPSPLLCSPLSSPLLSSLLSQQSARVIWQSHLSLCPGARVCVYVYDRRAPRAACGCAPRVLSVTETMTGAPRDPFYSSPFGPFYRRHAPLPGCSRSTGCTSSTNGSSPGLRWVITKNKTIARWSGHCI